MGTLKELVVSSEIYSSEWSSEDETMTRRFKKVSECDQEICLKPKVTLHCYHTIGEWYFKCVLFILNFNQLFI